MKPARTAADRGFTLIELLVVIAIIGIFASVSLIAMVEFRERAVKSRVEQEVASFQKAAGVYFANNQSYPDPLTAISAGSGVITDYCVEADGNGVPQKCCISRGGCTYSGDSYETLPEGGNFAAAAKVPRWLSHLGERAEAILGGTLPNFLTEAPVSGGDGLFKGVFYDCTTATCADANIYFSVPGTSCTRGEPHGGFDGVEGICEQNITAAGATGGSGGAQCGDGTCAANESCSADCASETHCDDATDNDEDTLTDDEDDDCETPSESDCANGADDDGDGDTDCDDADCAEEQRCTGVETSCSDGVDNDEDGAADGEDEDCYEPPTESDCTNATDDDGDGDTDCDDADCASDPTCAVSEDCETSEDEDGDGFGRCDDNDCSGWSSEYTWSSEVSYSYQYCSAGTLQTGSGSGSCANGADDDGDGCTDATDVDCGGGDSCGDGVDNNCDGSADEGCSSEDCWNWSDDDGDGDTDGCDSDCYPGDNGYCE